MIAFLDGNFIPVSPAMIYVDVQGVGYEVHISLHTYSAIRNLARGKIYTYLHVREDAHVLYGFATTEEKELFLLLVGVSGIGAATARMVLSSLPPAEIRRAIAEANLKVLEGIKGIGKKTAERLVLELKDKIAKSLPANELSSKSGNRTEDEALIALTALGIGRAQAESAVRIALQQNNEANVEELIKLALRNL